MNNDETNESNAEGEEVDKAVTPSEKLRAENDAMEKELERAKELKAKASFGGQSIAGQEEKQETQDDKDQAQADTLLAVDL